MIAGKPALMACIAIASAASAAGTMALDQFGIVRFAPVEEDRIQIVAVVPRPVVFAPPPPPAADRFAFVSLDLQPLLLVPEPQPAIPPPQPEQEIASAWTTETRAEKPPPPPSPPRLEGPHLLAETPRRLPSRVVVPRPPIRSYALAKKLAEISPGANQRLKARFDAAKAPWPPAAIALVAVKDDKMLELFARQEDGDWQFIHRYRVTAASGGPGPKLRQGDKQVPEGIYKISYLNPQSRYHVSLRVNYPNTFDRQMAAKDGRTDLGGDIMIHGKSASIGCIAIGDEAAEEVFVLAAHTGLPNIKLVIAPTDFRRRGIPVIEADQPKWLPALYTEVASAMSEFKSPPLPPATAVSLSSFFGN